MDINIDSYGDSNRAGNIDSYTDNYIVNIDTWKDRRQEE